MKTVYDQMMEDAEFAKEMKQADKNLDISESFYGKKMRILSLDMATKTGWACNDPEVSGVENFAVRRGESPGMRFVRFRAWLQEIIGHLKPDVVVYEKAHHRGGAATEVAVGLSTHMQGVLAEKGIEYFGCHTASLKLHATGKGNSKKPVMMEAYRKKWGCDPQDDNECDARWLLDWAKLQIGVN